MNDRDRLITIEKYQKLRLRKAKEAAMRLAFHVYYSPSASAHYIDLAKQEVEIVKDEAEIEVSGQRVRCVIEGVGLPPDRLAIPTLYLQRKGDATHAAETLQGEGHNLTSFPDISISELSRQSECHVETIRYYERIALLPKPRRQGRARRYGADDVARLKFIRRARQLGFKLEDVRTLLRLAAAPGQPLRTEARQLVAAHVEEVRAKIADLQAIERILTGAICQCDAGRGPACPIIEVISAPEIA